MKTRTSVRFVLAVLVLPSLAWNGPALAVDAKTQNDADTYRFLNLFGDVFERVRSEYVEPLTDEQMIEAAITGMLATLDPHSSYMNAKRFKEMTVNTRGEFGGLGIRVTMEHGYVKVISPIEGTPAHRAGIEAGDLVTHLDGEAVQGMTLGDAVEKMRGRVGSDIKLTIFREGREPFDVTVTRAIIKIDPVRSRVMDKVGYLRIVSFNEQTDVGVEKAFKKFEKEIGDDVQGYVLDLRNNPGGLLDQAIAVSDAFLDQGEIVSTRSRRPEDTKRHNARAGDLAEGRPMVVLINGGAASASEIVAGALQDHRRAVIMGTKSFGKGSVQTIIRLPGNVGMRLTTARYYTPSGRSIQAKGIEPDILVEQARIEAVTGPKRNREANLRGALDKNKNEDGKTENDKTDDGNTPSQPSKTGDEDKEEQAKADADTAPEDYQLARALDLIRGLALFQGEAATKAN